MKNFSRPNAFRSSLLGLYIRAKLKYFSNRMASAFHRTEASSSSGKGLTHLSLASLLWDIVKQNSPRCDAAENLKITPDAPKNESGLFQMIMMG